MRKLYACASPKCKGRIEEDEFEMLLDSGAELCLMSRNVFEELDLPIDLTVDWSVGSANSQKTKAYGDMLRCTCDGRGYHCKMSIFCVGEPLTEYHTWMTLGTDGESEA